MERTRLSHLEPEIIILIEPLHLRIQFLFFACMHAFCLKESEVSHRQKGSERCFRFNFTMRLKWRGQKCKDADVNSKTSLKQIFVLEETIANIWKPCSINEVFVTILLPAVDHRVRLLVLPFWVGFLCCFYVPKIVSLPLLQDLCWKGTFMLSNFKIPSLNGLLSFKCYNILWSHMKKCLLSSTELI